jgi:sec-independent protein translocase protein TatA
MFGSIGPLEIGIVVLIIVVLFGAKRLPELGSGLGRGMREFKEGITGEKRDDEKDPKGSDALPR